MNPTDALKTLLALDTSTAAASAALLHRGAVFSRFHAGHAKHTEALLPMIDELFIEAGIEARCLEGIIISAGPGAFTGLRVGASIAGGLAAAHGTPIACISSLALLAGGRELPVLAVLDARMGQVYGGLYCSGECLLPDRLCTAAELAAAADAVGRDYIIIGPGAAYFASGDKDALPNAADAFHAVRHLTFQDALAPIAINYLRDNIVQGAKEKA